MSAPTQQPSERCLELMDTIAANESSSLSADDRQHVATCAFCEEFAHGNAMVGEHFAQSRLELGRQRETSLADAVMSQIFAEPDPTPEPADQRRVGAGPSLWERIIDAFRGLAPAPAMAFAALIVAAGGVGIYYLTQGETSPTAGTPPAGPPAVADDRSAPGEGHSKAAEVLAEAGAEGSRESADAGTGLGDGLDVELSDTSWTALVDPEAGEEVALEGTLLAALDYSTLDYEDIDLSDDELASLDLSLSRDEWLGSALAETEDDYLAYP